MNDEHGKTAQDEKIDKMVEDIDELTVRMDTYDIFYQNDTDAFIKMQDQLNALYLNVKTITEKIS